ncbi:MAG: hypothetical protein A3G38_00735 [Omnitrophica WOR_2 bacterium RIFCSPLOWO2_12_FULL_51_8]|nr:MAG: hypothetical protein A3G38_00735 [Omnitrophica WOR_2 bacterium RIFCSPLOWO2_12_FULL_51_8]
MKSKIFAFVFTFLPISLLAQETLTITTYYPSPYGSYNELSTSGNTYLATTAAGRVGIGTTSPGSPLSVYKTDGYNSTAPLVNLTNLDGSVGQGNVLYLRGGADEATSYLLNATDSNGISKLWVGGAGKVGIGTASPVVKLHVRSGTGNASGQQDIDDIIIEDGGNAFLNLNSQASGAAGVWFSDNQPWRGGVYYNFTNDKLDLYSGSLPRLTIDVNGKVGIGTASPQAKLHILNSGGLGTRIDGADDDPLLEFYNGAFYRGSLVYTTSLDALRLTAGAAQNLLLTAANSNDKGIFVKTDGSVGIGTANPTAKLHVSGDVKIENRGVVSGRALCLKADKTIGSCSSLVLSNGDCTCN